MRIGITHTGPDLQKQANYFDWLRAATDAELVLLKHGEHLGGLTGFHGIVFTGGVDIHPSLYRGEEDYPGAPDQFRLERDKFEAGIFEQAQDEGIPVLGICRGMQLINVLCGGTLIQDLGPANEQHRAAPNDKAHGARVEPGTKLAEILGISETQVNSAHHQAVDKPSPLLRVSCWSSDGQVEALEWRDPQTSNFLLAVQWHPERMFRFGWENEPASDQIRKRFLEAVKKYYEDHQSRNGRIN